MFRFDRLEAPVVAAPMAGGVSTPALVHAVAGAGGFGFLAAGYQGPDALAEQVRETAALTGDRFGVNLFVPEDGPRDLAQVLAYRERLQRLAAQLEVELPRPHPDDDAWQAKLDVVRQLRVPVVSFTFGLPPTDVVRELHRDEVCVVASVADVEAARGAYERGVDVLCVQGPGAGGHRATLHCADRPQDVSLPRLLAAVRRAVDLPLLAAGGIGTPAQARSLRQAGAVAVQVGTGFLLADEAGTSATHRRALIDERFDRTAVTRAFSGRPARGLRNAFIEDFDSYAPSAYPEVNQITQPLRAAAGKAGDADRLHLWAGSGWRQALAVPAAEITRRLAAN